MPLDFRNTNSLWASILTETLKRLGLTTAVISPGSRSTPLTVSFAQQAGIEAIPVLDERSAAFFALGIAKKTKRPVAVVCTSGTAGANFYPAIIEAKESRVPLLILTADRPPELRDCHSGQTIDQVKLYGNYPNWQTELAVPSLELGMLNYLRQTIGYAWERSLFPVAGVVHLNIPFRDPLAPIPQPEAQALASQFQSSHFFDFIPQPEIEQPISPPASLLQAIETWQQYQQGIIIAGPVQPKSPQAYVSAIAYLSKALNFPVLAEALSPLRNYAHLNPYLISTYDLILRNPKLAETLQPELVIQLGELPTSKELRTWLEKLQPQRFILDASHHNFDPLHGRTTHLRVNLEKLNLAELVSNLPPHPYLLSWCHAESKVRQAIDTTMESIDSIVESKAAWLISQTLPPETPLFISNSMPVRDVEFFWVPNHSRIQPFFNRGANGIDGTLSTALGIAHDSASAVMLTGDLALLHDTNGFLLHQYFRKHLTILLINNNGGGIFGMLPIAQFDPPFEAFFATPQNIDFAQLCATYGVEHAIVSSWEELKQKLNPLPSSGIRVLELQTNRQADAAWRQENLPKFAANLDV